MTDTQKPITLKECTFVGVWEYDLQHTKCSICQINLQLPCAHCTEKDQSGEIGCHISLGKCGHPFHEHCINKWLQDSNSCPLDKVMFGFESKNIDSTDKTRTHLAMKPKNK